MSVYLLDAKIAEVVVLDDLCDYVRFHAILNWDPIDVLETKSYVLICLCPC